MLSLRFIRENPDAVRDGIRRKRETAPLDELLEADRAWRAGLTRLESLRAERNASSQQMARVNPKPPELLAQLRALGDEIKTLETSTRELEERVNDLLLYIPNIPRPDVPDGESEADNVDLRRWGDTGRLAHGGPLDFTPKPHWEIAEALGIADFERGVKIAGSRFYVLKGLGARLERALLNFFLDVHTGEHGYTEVWPTYLVKSASMLGTGNLPKFAEDAYRIEGEDLWLIPTAEVPVTNFHRDEILEPGSLPIKYVAFSPCFRSEAGASGRDTRGMVRVHQFSKVEMVKFVEPGTSDAELEHLLGNAETILQRLNLPYRVLLMCAADLGFTQVKKYDPEAWFPGLNRFVEISSCSNFADFQARRANIRYRPTPGAPPEFVHTLNGSGLAIGRTIAAILENYQLADGTVVVPEAIRGYMGGVTRIGG